jgi:exopolyphosphatase/guanosine-5'-triphosphate,3'-diphosphate pyrophosphatase
MGETAVGATVECLEGFAATIGSLGADRIGAVATSASRDAENGTEVMERIAGILGVVPEIVTGEREARLAFGGATADRGTSGPEVVVDIGGGSTELIRGHGSRILWSHSYDIGSVRLTDRCLPDRPALRGQLEAAADEVARILGEPTPRVRTAVAIGVAGTFTSLAAIHLGLAAYDPDAVDGTTLGVDDVAALVDRLSRLSVSQTAALPSLEPRRAPIILSGAVIAEQVLRTIGAERVIVSEHDLLDGLAAELLRG